MDEVTAWCGFLLALYIGYLMSIILLARWAWARGRAGIAWAVWPVLVNIFMLVISHMMIVGHYGIAW